MCNVIESEELLVNILAYKDGTEVSFRELRELRERIERRLEDTVYVDITSSSLCRAISSHRLKFQLRMEDTKIVFDDTVNRLRNLLLMRHSADLDRQIGRKYNWRIPEDSRNSCIETIKTYYNYNVDHLPSPRGDNGVQRARQERARQE